MSGKPKTPPTVAERAQITTLSASGMSQNKIAKNIKRSRHLVRNVLAEPETQKVVGDEKAALAALYRGKARDVVTSISDSDIAKASLQQKSVSSGILLDKSLLLEGEPTSIVAVQAQVLLDVADLIRRKRDQADEAAQREWQAQHTLPAPQTQPQTKTPRPAISFTPVTPAPQPQTQPAKMIQRPTEPTVKYYPVPLHTPDDNEDNSDPLMRGLFNPDK